ncbi:MAG: protein translocase subunit SecD [Spirochaetaceae bacterium]|nr:protein translocase subunit SecD [Spirochaetaceae bacterium]
MNKLARLLIVTAITALAAFFLMPTVRWYLFTSEELREAANEPLELIGARARALAETDVNRLIAAANAGGGLEDNLSYFIPFAQQNHRNVRATMPSNPQAVDILRYSPGRASLISFSADYHAGDVMAAKAIRDRAIKLGLDLAGGLSITLNANFDVLNNRLVREFGREATASERDDAMATALAIIRNRADQFGTVDPIIRRQGTSQITIELPGESDPDAANRLIMGSGSLAFHLVDNARTQQIGQVFAGNPSLANQIDAAGRLPDTTLLPAGFIVAGQYTQDSFGSDVFQRYVVLFEEVGLDGNHITNAQVSTDEFGHPVVNFTLDGEGATIFARLTENAATNGHALAVIMESRVRSVAGVQQAITGGRVQVSGFSFREATNLATILRTASLPLEFTVQNLQRIGPSLGEDSIRRGLQALIWGVAMSLVFILLYYTGAGLLACITLGFNFLFLLAILSFMGFTLTLNSMAGLVLTIAMAVDANILVFQRIKDELRLGRERAAAVSGGFEKAFLTIIDANLTTLIAAFCLALLASGPIRGFAVTLIAGIVTTLFTSIYILRLLFDIGTETFKRKTVFIGFRRIKKDA